MLKFLIAHIVMNSSETRLSYSGLNGINRLQSAVIVILI